MTTCGIKEGKISLNFTFVVKFMSIPAQFAVGLVQNILCSLSNRLLGTPFLGTVTIQPVGLLKGPYSELAVMTLGIVSENPNSLTL